jgi:hypothetical protein
VVRSTEHLQDCRAVGRGQDRASTLQAGPQQGQRRVGEVEAGRAAQVPFADKNAAGLPAELPSRLQRALDEDLRAPDVEHGRDRRARPYLVGDYENGRIVGPGGLRHECYVYFHRDGRPPWAKRLAKPT